MIKVSVIIPVYNAKDFIVDCVQSLLCQTLKECEFIFVIDGSTDESEFILKEFQLSDSRIVIIVQENKGISCARNAGIEMSKGEYIGFLDNDDYVKTDMFEVLYYTAIDTNVDIVVSNTILGRDGKFINKKPVFEPNVIHCKEFIQMRILESLLKEEDLFAVWNKLYKRELIFKNNVRFPANRIIEEDNMFNIQAFNHASNVVFLEYSGYFYRDVATSESRLTIKRDYFQKSLDKYHFDYIKEYGLKINCEKVNLLKGARFVKRATYLFFKVSTGTDAFNAKMNYISKMILNSELQNEVKTIKKNPYFNAGKFEKLVLLVTIKKSIFGVFMLMLMIKVLYQPVFSEIIRKLNK